MTKRRLQTLLQTFALALAAIAAAGCIDVGRDADSGYTYATAPVLIYNADWGQLPLPNNLLNPAKQAEIPVIIPGTEPPLVIPTTISLPITDKAAADKAVALGYPVTEDSPLTAALKKGQNMLDGFTVNFIPSVPFSQKIDANSLVYFDGGNGETANVFFLDVTDPANPSVLAPENYIAIFNLEGAAAMPYSLKLRKMGESDIEPADFEYGHTYLIVVTGWNDKGVKDETGKPVKGDSYFSLFASEEAYIAADGSPRNSVLSDINAVRTLEGARQITDWGLKAWEKVVDKKRVRNEVIASFHFTVMTNPTPLYMNPTKVLMGGNPLLPTPVDYAALDSSEKAVMKTADAKADAPITFAVSTSLAETTVNNSNIKLFKVGTDKYTEVTAVVSYVAPAAEGSFPAVKIVPSASLECGTKYVVAVSNGVTGGIKNHPAVDQTYFGLTRVDTPLVNEAGTDWLSPFLDSRIDTLIMSGKIDEPTDANLAASKTSVLKVLKVLEAMRKENAPHITRLVQDKFAAKAEDIALLWAFTTKSDSCK